MKEKGVILKKGKEKAIKQRHHWIFSGAVKSLPGFEDGSILPVFSSENEFLGHAYFNKKCSIIGRMVNFDDTPPLQAIEDNIGKAAALRRTLFDEGTNAFRLVNGEGDNLPGLIVDRYADVLVLQVSTLGMEKLKPFVIEILKNLFSPRSIYEKSTLLSRREEGLADREGLISGEPAESVEVIENRMRFLVAIPGSQKTGFFLDQREMRNLVRSLARKRKVLDCFSYTGGFSVSALHGGADAVDLVDTSEKALELARQNVVLNGFSLERCSFHAEDVFAFLRQGSLNYDFIILDPPAFAKKKADVAKACHGYRDINRLALQSIASQGFLLTFSCSYFIDEKLFQKVIFQASLEAGRRVRLLQRHRHAFDHPLNVFHPEGSYLKGFLLFVE